MNTEQERAELLPCPFCGGSVSFHQDDEECRDGCHYIECKTCGMFDLSTTADPNNQIESLSDLRDRIAPLWNRRAALQSQDADRLDWLQQSDGRFFKLLHITSIVGRGFSPTNSNGKWFPSLRDAIDRARRIEGVKND